MSEDAPQTPLFWNNLLVTVTLFHILMMQNLLIPPLFFYTRLDLVGMEWDC